MFSLLAVFSTAVLSDIVTLQGEDVDSQELRSLIVERWEVEKWDIVAKPGFPESIAITKLVPGSPANMPKVMDYTGYAAPTLTTDGKQVYALFGNGDIIALDFAGKKIWCCREL